MNQFIEFFEMWYQQGAFWGQTIAIISDFLSSLMRIWWTNELVKWECHFVVKLRCQLLRLVHRISYR